MRLVRDLKKQKKKGKKEKKCPESGDLGLNYGSKAGDLRQDFS